MKKIRLVNNCTVKVEHMDGNLDKRYIVFNKSHLQKVLGVDTNSIVIDKALTILSNCKVFVKHLLITLLEDCQVQVIPSLIRVSL